MVKSAQMDQITSDDYKWGYLTTITKAQIRTLINRKLIQLELFEDEIIEVEDEDGSRYILRKNKYRAEEIANNRKERIKAAKSYTKSLNQYLQEHPKAKVGVAQKKIEEKISHLKLKEIVSIEQEDRGFSISIDEFKLEKQAELDGCYVVKTEVPKEELDTKVVHDRYKDLGLVEYAFRTMKTTLEELQPIFVRKEDRTRGHVFVVMLAYMITKYLSDKIQHLEYTRKFTIASLDKIQYIEYMFKGKVIKTKPTKFPKHTHQMLEALGLTEKVAKKK